MTVDKSTPKNWTIMIYLVGDNNLSENMAETLFTTQKTIQQIKRSDQSNINVLVYYDSSVQNIPPSYHNLNTQFFIPVVKSKVFQRYLNMDGRSNSESSDSADSIVNFVKWCVEEQGCVANNYALFLSGHTNAFDESILLRDNNSLEVLTIPGLKSALLQIDFIINKKSTKKEKKLLDILGFDSCLMSMLEIGYEFKGLVNYIIASQGETPISGWDYNSIIGSIDFSNKDVKTICGDFVNRYFNSQLKFLVGGRSVNLTAWDIDESNLITEKFTELIEALQALLKGQSLLTSVEIEKSIINAHWSCQTHWLDQAIDIKDFCHILFSDIDLLYVQFTQLQEILKDCKIDAKSTPELAGNFINDLKFVLPIADKIRIKCNETISAIDSCIIANAVMGPEFQFSNGISLFFPWSLKAYRTMKHDYKCLEFSNSDNGCKWVEFLDYFLNERTKRTQKSYFKKDKTSKIDLPNFISFNSDETRVEKRGKVTDPDRGKITDPDRGEANDPFSEFKNLNPDNYGFNQLTTRIEKPVSSELKFSKDMSEWRTKRNMLYDR